MNALVALVLFYGSRGNNWANPPQALIELLTEWFAAADVQHPHQFWVEDVRPAEKVMDPAIIARRGRNVFFEIEAYVPRESGNDIWTLHMNWNPEVITWTYNALIEAMEFFRLDPTQVGCPVYNRMVSLWEIFSGRPFVFSAVTDGLAHDAFFRDANDLIARLRFLAKRGFFVTEGEANPGEPAFYWTKAFEERMESIDEDRRERLLHLTPITLDDVASRLDDFQGEMLDALGFLKPEMFDTGQQVRVPRGFLGLTEVALEHFIGLLAAAGVVTAVSDSEYGILGKVWKVDVDKRQRVLDRYHTRHAAPPSSTESAPPAPLPRDQEIEQRLRYARSLNEGTAARIKENDARLAEVKGEIFQLEGRLALLRANQASLEGTLLDDRGGHEATCRDIERMELELAALSTVLDEQAAMLVAEMKKRAIELNLDPEKLLAAVRAELVSKRAN